MDAGPAGAFLPSLNAPVTDRNKSVSLPLRLPDELLGEAFDSIVRHCPSLRAPSDPRGFYVLQQSKWPVVCSESQTSNPALICISDSHPSE